MQEVDLNLILTEIIKIAKAQATILQRQEDSDRYLKGVVEDIAARLDRHDEQLLAMNKIENRLCQVEEEVKSIPEIKQWQLEAGALLDYLGELKKWQIEKEPVINDLQYSNTTHKDYKKIAATAVITLLITKGPEWFQWLAIHWGGKHQ